MQPIYGVLLAAAWSLGLVEPGIAGFLGTEWGMSRAEVVAATNGLAQEYQDPRNVPMKDQLAVVIALTPSIQMTAFYRFYSEGTLAGIKLLPNDPTQCSSIRQVLGNSYGAARASMKGDNGSLEEWFDVPALNIVTFVQAHPSCSLDYKPLHPVAAKAFLDQQNELNKAK
jgi:hypothetical protein